MFKNFSKVLSFSLKNQVGTKGYKVVTSILGILFFALPVIIMFITAYNKNKDKALESCGANRIYVVDKTSGDDSFWSGLKDLPEDLYSNIRYIKCSNIQDAFMKAERDNDSLILVVSSGKSLNAEIIIPADSKVGKKQAKNYYSYIEKYDDLFKSAFSGISAEQIEEISKTTEYKNYTETGYKNGYSIDEDTERNDSLMRARVLNVLKMVLPYGTILLLYFLLLTYGQTLAQSVVMEKESKLMDTMLISVKPESLVFGKLLSCVFAVLIQVLIWIGSLVLGLALGNTLTEIFYPGSKQYLKVFFSGMEELNVFRPMNVVLAVIFLLLGFVLYLCLAAIAGSMSSTKEEVSSRNMIFIFPLLVSFFAVMFFGGMNADTTQSWMLILPFTASMIMPADVMLGVVSTGTIAASVICMILLIILLIIGAGRIYKMMSLYKGNKLSVSEVLKRSFGTK